MKFADEILKAALLKPTKSYAYTAEDRKWEIFRAINDLQDKDKIREAMKLRKDKLLSTVDFVKQVMKSNLVGFFELDEAEVLEREKEYLAKEFGCEILINDEYDPKGKQRFAIPLKPAIFVVE